MNKPLPHYSKDIEVTIEGGFYGGYEQFSRPITLRLRSNKHCLSLNVAITSPDCIAAGLEDGLHQLARRIGEKEVFGA